MKRKNIITWLGITGLIVPEQGIKLIINRFFLDASVPVVPSILYFRPMFNRQYSWFNSMLRFEGGKWLHIVIVTVLIVLLVLFYRYLRKKMGPDKIINVMFAFIFAGAMCSLIDKVFWDGSLDYILLNGFFTFDLKDVYINVFNGFLIYLLLFRSRYLNDIARTLSGRTRKEGPMRVLIIYAHPDPKSFNAAILGEMKRGLKDGGHDVTVIDLYADQYNPVLVFNENVKRSDVDEKTKRYQELIAKADHLIFIYPVWWYGLPAILKGFFDRVLTPGFAYIFKNGRLQGLLGDKSVWVLYTMGTPGWYVTLVRGNAEWHALLDGTLKFCGIKDIKRMRFAGINGSAQKRREKWLAYIYKEAKNAE